MGNENCRHDRGQPVAGTPWTTVPGSIPAGAEGIEEIRRLVALYNAKAGRHDSRIVIDVHAPLCRCSHCWYKLGSESRNARAEAGL